METYRQCDSTNEPQAEINLGALAFYPTYLDTARLTAEHFAFQNRHTIGIQNSEGHLHRGPKVLMQLVEPRGIEPLTS